jgi:hypothetical protein
MCFDLAARRHAFSRALRHQIGLEAVDELRATLFFATEAPPAAGSLRLSPRRGSGRKALAAAPATSPEQALEDGMSRGS